MLDRKSAIFGNLNVQYPISRQRIRIKQREKILRKKSKSFEDSFCENSQDSLQEKIFQISCKKQFLETSCKILLGI